MRAFEQLLGRRADASGESRFTFQDWVDLFQFGGNSYPILNQSWAPLTEESLAGTARAAYDSNGPIFALVLARLQVFSQARFVWQRNGGGPTDTFGNKALRLLERPWPGGTTGDLLARMEVDVSTAGNCYVRRLPNRLSCMRPDYTTIVLGSQEDADHPGEASDVEVAGFLYKPPHGEPRFFLPHEVAHYAPIPAPGFNFLGMSWVSTVLADVMGDDAATLHKRKFFQNAATPNLAIKFDPTVSVEQVKEFKAILEAEHKGVWNAYKTLYLGGGADPVMLGKDFQQLEFSATQGKGESRLAAAAGVPPSWVGFSEGLQGSSLNAGNFTAARRRFGDGTMYHLWSNACASLEPIIGETPGAHLWFDVSHVPFMREDAKDASDIAFREAQTITALVRDGFTAESAVEAVQKGDWSLLKHTGRLSVQLQDPDQPNADAANTAQEGDAS